MTSRVKVSKNHQISVPAEARRKLGIKSGDHLLIDVRDGYLVVVPEPDDYARHLRGLHKEIWEGVSPDAYVQDERNAWKD
jgi:AbrB family looped-hinge helix DNA binding protein